jgi:hypothetical protein
MKTLQLLIVLASVIGMILTGCKKTELEGIQKKDDTVGIKDTVNLNQKLRVTDTPVVTDTLVVTKDSIIIVGDTIKKDTVTVEPVDSNALELKKWFSHNIPTEYYYIRKYQYKNGMRTFEYLYISESTIKYTRDVVDTVDNSVISTSTENYLIDSTRKIKANRWAWRANCSRVSTGERLNKWFVLMYYDALTCAIPNDVEIDDDILVRLHRSDYPIYYKISYREVDFNWVKVVYEK